MLLGSAVAPLASDPGQFAGSGAASIDAGESRGAGMAEEASFSNRPVEIDRGNVRVTWRNIPAGLPGTT